MRKLQEAEAIKVPEALVLKLEIDENNLLGECSRQMILEEKYGKLLAEAEFMLNAAQTAVKTRRSELILKVQSNPSLIDGSMNVQTVEAFYRTQASYKKLVQEENDAQFRHTQIENAMFSLSRRSAMLQLLVNARLRNSGTFDPTASTSVARSELREIEHADTNKRLGKRLNKKGDETV
jgi:hypothetical protein